MNLVKKIYSRIYQNIFHIALPLLPYNFPEELENVKAIPNLLEEQKINSVLIITDKNIINNNLLDPLLQALEKNKIEFSIYDEVEPNPSIENVEKALELYLVDNCKGIIAFGGGSPLDCAKAVGALIARPSKDLKKMEGILKVGRKLPLLIAIPTTAGTGSEVTLTAVITDKKNKHKYTINDFFLIPDYVVLDPQVIKTLPPHLTATTGMDALTHAVEAYIGNSTTEETRSEALKAVELIFKNLKTSYENGEDLEARKNMLIASNLAGKSFSRSYVGYVHAIAHSLGGQYNLPHGFTNAVILPVVLEEYGNTIDKKLYDLANTAGLLDKNDTVKTGAEKFIQAIKELNQYFQIPEKFEEIKLEDIEIMAKHADKEANPLYPVPKLMNKNELMKIYFRLKK